MAKLPYDVPIPLQRNFEAVDYRNPVSTVVKDYSWKDLDKTVLILTMPSNSIIVGPISIYVQEPFDNPVYVNIGFLNFQDLFQTFYVTDKGIWTYNLKGLAVDLMPLKKKTDIYMKVISDGDAYKNQGKGFFVFQWLNLSLVRRV